MKLKLNALVAALAALAATGAHASITNAQAGSSFGNSSVLFVAQDAAMTTSLTIDLGVNMTDFLQSSAFVGSSGALSGAGTTASWTFGGNARTVNGASVAGDYAWNTVFDGFVAASGGNYTWGVVAADNVTGAISGTNTVFNRNVLSTGTPTQTNINNVTFANSLSTATANFTQFVAGTTGGTHASNAEGASTATSGGGYLDTVMKGTFGGSLPWNYLSAIGATSNVFLTQQASNPVVYQIGASYGVDTLLSAADAATFAFDGSTLTFGIAAPVPEPGSFAMLLAGLTAVGFMARRRSGR